jgi:hypothetical protein
MSRTEEDISSRVDITIMRHSTLRTYPTSYSEFCDTFRPRLASARRTDSGRERFIDFLVPSPVRKRFVAEHVSEGRPACIEDRFRHVGLGESGGVHVAHRDVIELSNDAGRELVLKVTARMADACVDVGRLTPFSGPLSGRESGGQLPQVPRVFDLLPVGQGSEVLEPQVDANTAAHRPRIRLSDFHGNVQIPMTPGIAGEAGSVLDLTLRQRPRVEHPEGVSSKAKGVALALEVTALEGHPAQRSPAAPTQERELLLTTRVGVLLAHRVDRARVQGEFLAAASGQAIQIETARPALIPFQRVLLGVVAEIPDEITGARLPVDLGLRSGEIAALRLDDIDWRAGTVVLRNTKSRREHALPLPEPTGRAIAAYLKYERPKSAHRGVFVRRMAPHDDLIGPDLVRKTIRQAYERAGLPYTRSHLLRHTMASRLLAGGSSLKEVADVLRHRSLNTTLIYAKLDSRNLREVALPWPGSAA